MGGRPRHHDATSTSPSPTCQPPSFVPATGATTCRRGHATVAEEDTPPTPATLHHADRDRQTIAAEVPRHRNRGAPSPPRQNGGGRTRRGRRGMASPQTCGAPHANHGRCRCRGAPAAGAGGRRPRRLWHRQVPGGTSGGLARGSGEAQGGSGHRTRERHRRGHHEETPEGKGEGRRGRGWQSPAAAFLATTRTTGGRSGGGREGERRRRR
jgi:hypothetical protein